MYIYICIERDIYTHAYVYIYIYTCIRIHTSTYVYIYIYISIIISSSSSTRVNRGQREHKGMVRGCPKKGVIQRKYSCPPRMTDGVGTPDLNP